MFSQTGKREETGTLITRMEGNRIKNAYLRIVCRNSAISNLFLRNMPDESFCSWHRLQTFHCRWKRVVSLGCKVLSHRQALANMQNISSMKVSFHFVNR
ncbi:hypothetical protein CEXT_569521 [Caerostris extrusa]|uniref:Uncharacterized protein n=1 Tax=Caerostris extrusa TaxID=172846 RepID=A0AAV4REL1_CAEEX|nr:hypothetical protein CEXT_569521 [Caerostris extrusa]